MSRTIRRYKEHNLSDWGAALTYYSVLSLFPAAVVLVAILGVFGSYPETTDALLRIVEQLGPSSAVETFRGPVESVVRNKGGAGALLGFGLLGALWSASAYVGAFMRASNMIYQVEERRFWKNTPLRIAITVLMVLLLAIVSLAIVLTGPLASAVGNVIGLSSVAVTVWSIAKWPVLVVLVMTMISVLFYLAPNVRQPGGYRWVTPGAVIAVLAWIAASIGFALYVAFFGSYNKTYGSLGAVIVFLVWLYITNNALLLGVLINAERERQRELDSGLPAEERLQVARRDARK
ncbi:MAG: YihY/virulence factor BrkB family protein [Actinomycetota bacterium]|nr:YihY/virulence factor BrkB family protein [Actinomycetota bacterium]